MGAYMMLITPGVPLLGVVPVHGVYETPKFSFTCNGWFTNLTPTDAYRGAGRPEASFAIERAMDMLAGEVGVGPDEIRRRNYINGGEEFDRLDESGRAVVRLGPLPAQPRRGPRAGRLSTGFATEQQRRRDAARRSSSALGCAPMSRSVASPQPRAWVACNYAAGGWEHATVRMLPTGKVEVVSGSTPHGQGHETSWSQIIASKMGIDPPT